MRAIIQRVWRGAVAAGGQQVSSINQGMLVLVGITHDDTADDANFMCAFSPSGCAPRQPR